MNLGKYIMADDIFFSVIKKHDIKSVSIFGSAIRDDFNDNSDIDILIEFNNSSEKSLLDLIDLRLELEDISGRAFDVIEKDSIKNPYKNNEINSAAGIFYFGMRFLEPRNPLRETHKMPPGIVSIYRDTILYTRPRLSSVSSSAKPCRISPPA
jgi:predicted nucleotidyltransferase